MRDDRIVPSFNLVTEPWLPVRAGGRLREVSLAEAVLEARRFERIEDPSPLVVAALHRFLLAVLLRALKGPTNLDDAADWFRDGFPEAAVRDYLARYQDRFDLFDPAAPFYQTPDFGLELSSRSWTILAPELNSDNNKVLFDHTITANPPPLGPAAAARLLIANQAFALSAGKSVLCHTATAPVATAATVLAQGRTLHETLCLNLGLHVHHADDQASWEAPPLSVADLRQCDSPIQRRSPRGIVDRYTWPSRAIRLHPEQRDGETVVFWISYASGVRCDELHIVRDPLLAYRQDAKDATRTYPLGFRQDRAFWRDFHALRPAPERGVGVDVLNYAGALLERVAEETDEPAPPVQVAVLGQVNDQAKIELWRHERYELPAALLTDVDAWVVVDEALRQAEDVGRALNGAARKLAECLLARGDRQPHRDDIAQKVRNLPHAAVYWSALEVEFGHWLARPIASSIERAERRQEWHTVVERQAWRAWQETIRAAGNDPKVFRAIVTSEGVLKARLSVSHKEISV